MCPVCLPIQALPLWLHRLKKPPRSSDNDPVVFKPIHEGLCFTFNKPWGHVALCILCLCTAGAETWGHVHRRQIRYHRSTSPKLLVCPLYYLYLPRAGTTDVWHHNQTVQWWGSTPGSLGAAPTELNPQPQIMSFKYRI